MKKILISSCLAGRKVRYDGKVVPVSNRLLEKWQGQNRLVQVCPEVDGGLAIPRPPAQIAGGTGDDVLNGNARVVDENGKDVTVDFIKGAHLALDTGRKYGIQVAVFKEKSPSCGVNRIYDGTFSGCLISGTGVAVALLKKNNIQVFSENELEKVEFYLKNAKEFMNDDSLCHGSGTVGCKKGAL